MALILAIALSIGVPVEPAAFLVVSTLYLLAVRIAIAPDSWGTGKLAVIGALSRWWASRPSRRSPSA